MHEDPLEVGAKATRALEAAPAELSTRGLLPRQWLLGWSQPPQRAILQGVYMSIFPGLLVLYFGVASSEAAGLLHERPDPTAAIFSGTLSILYLVLMVAPALVVLARGLLDWRARPRLVGGRVLAARHLPGRRSQRHYVLLETPIGQRERFRVDPALHNQCCQPGAQVALRVSPRLRYVSKVWSDAAEPPILV